MKKQIFAAVEGAKLEEILIEFKASKIPLSSAAQKIDALYEATARFVGLSQMRESIDLQRAHFASFEEAVQTQNKDMKELIKALIGRTK